MIPANNHPEIDRLIRLKKHLGGMTMSRRTSFLVCCQVPSLYIPTKIGFGFTVFKISSKNYSRFLWTPLPVPHTPHFFAAALAALRHFLLRHGWSLLSWFWVKKDRWLYAHGTGQRSDVRYSVIVFSLVNANFYFWVLSLLQCNYAKYLS